MTQTMARPKYILFALWSWLWPLAPAWAADIVLPEVNVKGDRLDQLEGKYPDLQADHALNPYRVAPSSRLAVQTFTAEDIEAIKPLDVFDLLNHAVGVLALYQGRKVPYSVRIRGDLYFAYIIDGVYIPSETGGRILQNLPLSAIEKVEVVRDATALTLAPMVDFGRPSGAPNDGYIVIRTRRPLGPEATGAVRTESFNTQAANLYAGTANEQAYVSGVTSHFQTASKPGENMARHSDASMIRTGYTGPGFRADLSAFSDETRQEIQAADPKESTLGLQRWRLDPIKTTFAALNLSQQWNDAHTTTCTVSTYRLTATMVAGTALPGISPNIFPNLETIDNIDLKHTVRFDNTLLRFGGQRMHWDTPTGASYYEGYPRDERITGYFATAEQSLMADKLVLDVAARRDQQVILRGVDHYYAYQMLFQQPSIFNRALPADHYLSTGMAYSPSADWKLTARAYAAKQGAAENVPALDNKVLHPESQRKAEAGLNFVGWDTLRPALTLFFTHISHVKYPAKEVRAQNGLTTSLWDETNVNRRGLELMFKGEADMFSGLTEYTAGWTYLFGDTTNEDYGRTSPRNTLAFTVKHHHGPWDGAVSLSGVSSFQSNWKATDRQFHAIGYYSRLDLNTGLSFKLNGCAPHLSLYGRNVMNQHYETQLGYRDIGAIWGVELRMDI